MSHRYFTCILNFQKMFNLSLVSKSPGLKGFNMNGEQQPQQPTYIRRLAAVVPVKVIFRKKEEREKRKKKDE